MNYAPILILTLNRYTHLKRCVESLAKCTYADKTDLFIALDYPLKEEHWNGYRKIKEYVSNIEGFNKVTIIQRDHNYGPFKNFYNAQNQIYEKYDRIIVTEDDNEFAPGFLDYINKGLYLFENNPSITAICGFKSLINIPVSYQNNYFCSYRFSAWGYGTWQFKQNPISNQIINAQNILCNPLRFFKLLMIDNTLARYLITMFKNSTFYGDALQELYNVREKKYSIYPTVSKVRNFGHDGSGIHGGYIKDSHYAKVEMDHNSTFIFSSNNIIIDNNIYKQIRRLRQINIKRMFKLLIDYFYLICTGKCNKNHIKSFTYYF